MRPKALLKKSRKYLHMQSNLAFSDYSIVARSLEEYIERTRESSDHCADALNVLLREVDPIGSEMIQIYLGQDEDEEGEVPSSND